MNNLHSERDLDLVCNAFLSLKTKNEVKRFLGDILTPKEFSNLLERLKIAKKLYQGKHTYRTLAKSLNCSTTTITKVANQIHKGQGGYHKVLSRLNAPTV